MAGSSDFQLVKLEQGVASPIYDGDGQLLTFRTGDEAGEEARKMSKRLGVKVQPRRVFDSKWRDREADRLKDGSYKPLPWSNESWWNDLQSIWKDHFPHVSVQKQALVAFTESPEKGAADVQTPLKIGKYLERFFADKIDEYTRRDLCAVFASKFESQDLLFTEDADEVEEIFTTGPHSCMSKVTKDYGVKTHPVLSYLAGDLQLAYLRRKGRVVARCMVWPEKHLHNTIYGDAALMTPALKKAGYKSGSLAGARMKKVVQKSGERDHCFVVPHVDNSSFVKDDGEFLVIQTQADDNSIQIGSGTGKTVMLSECPVCTRSRVKDKMLPFHIKGKTVVACTACSKEHAFHCPLTGHWTLKADAIEVIQGRRKLQASRSSLTAQCAFRCEGSGLYYTTDHLVVMEDGRRWSKEWANDHGYRCTSCASWLENSVRCSCSDRDYPSFFKETRV